MEDPIAHNEAQASALANALGEDYGSMQPDRASKFRETAYSITENVRGERKAVLQALGERLVGWCEEPDDPDMVPGFLAVAASIHMAIEESDSDESLGQFDLTADDFAPDPMSEAKPGEPFNAVSHGDVCGHVEIILDETCERPPHPGTWWHASGDEEGNVFAIWSDTELFYAEEEE